MCINMRHRKVRQKRKVRVLLIPNICAAMGFHICVHQRSSAVSNYHGSFFAETPALIDSIDSRRVMVDVARGGYGGRGARRLEIS